MYETLTRTHDPVPVVPALKPISSAIDRIRAVETKKGKRRDMQILEAKRKREEKEKRAREEEATSGEPGTEGVENVEGGPPSAKKRKTEDETNETGEMEDEEMASASTTRPSTPTMAATTTSGKVEKEYVLKPSPYTRGHTSYLTFAVLLPVGESKDVKEPELEKAEVSTAEEEKGEQTAENGGSSEVVVDSAES